MASPVEEGVAATTVEERRGWPLRDLGATGVRAWSDRAGAGGAFGIGRDRFRVFFVYSFSVRVYSFSVSFEKTDRIMSIFCVY